MYANQPIKSTYTCTYFSEAFRLRVSTPYCTVTFADTRLGKPKSKRHYVVIVQRQSCPNPARDIARIHVRYFPLCTLRSFTHTDQTVHAITLPLD